MAHAASRALKLHRSCRVVVAVMSTPHRNAASSGVNVVPPW